MRIKMMSVLFVFFAMTGTIYAMEDVENPMDELNQVENDALEKECKQLAKSYVGAIAGNTKDKIRITRIQKVLMSMNKKTPGLFKKFKTWKKKLRKRPKKDGKKTKKDSEKTEKDIKTAELAKIVELTMLIQDHLQEKNERLKEKKTGLQQDNEKKDGKISCCKKLTGILSGVSVTAVISAIVAAYQAFKGGDDCQLKTNCQSLIASNSSYSELNTFCTDLVSKCK